MPAVRKLGPAPALIVAVVMLASAAAAIAAATPAPGITLVRVAGGRVRPGYGQIVRLSQTVAVSGTVTHPPADARIQLQGRTISTWRPLLTVAVRGDTFTLHWRVRTRESQVRAALLLPGGPIATSAAASLLVGPAIVRCRPSAAPTALPAGDGWIAGGVYLQGGPAPGIDECQTRPSTITAVTSDGSVAATEPLAGGVGYALVVPADVYRLADGGCTGQATVTPGRRAVADTDCDFP